MYLLRFMLWNTFESMQNIRNNIHNYNLFNECFVSETYLSYFLIKSVRITFLLPSITMTVPYHFMSHVSLSYLC